MGGSCWYESSRDILLLERRWRNSRRNDTAAFHPDSMPFQVLSTVDARATSNRASLHGWGHRRRALLGKLWLMTLLSRWAALADAVPFLHFPAEGAVALAEGRGKRRVEQVNSSLGNGRAG